MKIKFSNRQVFSISLIFVLASLAGTLNALQEPDREGLGVAEFRADILEIDNLYQQPKDLPAQAYANAQADLDALGVRADSGFVDRRGGRWANLLLSEPLLPGSGKGNGLSWAGLNRKAPKSDNEMAQAATQAFRGYLNANSHPLRVDLGELPGAGKVTVYENSSKIHIHMPRTFEGVRVRGSYLKATINHGNLVLFGTENWGDIKTRTQPDVALDAARQNLQAYIDPYPVDGEWGKAELMLVPVVDGRNLNSVEVGKGFAYRLAWAIRPAFDGDMRRFEALVDAHSGQLLSFEDTNHYAEVKGGVLPVTNDGIVPDGVEQAGWPMPYADATGGTTDTGGNIDTSGSVTTDFYGPYVNINDNCGSSSLTSSSGVLDWGTSGGTDCTTPGFGGAGNTHASRTGFYELNKVIEMGRGQLPGNSWLQQRLTSNMNINNTCNAFWNGTVNFYRSGGGCSNTGEIAGIFDHEWGHGMDANDATPGIASPSGEGIADIYTALRLNDSCIGRNFRSSNCSTCQSCTGVRDIDYMKKKTGSPSTFSWANSNCGSSVHCKGHVYSEAVWSLWKRELPTLYGYDDNTAHEIVNRLTYIAAGNTGTWYSGTPDSGGCAADSGYMNFLAADDDDGDLTNGTPHMQAIFNAFDTQEIACNTPTVQDGGCSGVPTAAPTVTGTASNQATSLSWTSVAGADSYEVFRTEGVFGCDFGKVKLGSTTGNLWNDTGLQNGREYYYVVIPKGSADACFGPASSCTTVQPAAGPGVKLITSVASSTLSGGDSDDYLDNCEDSSTNFDILNNGLGALTNVRIASVTPSNGGVTINGTSGATPNLAQGATTSASFSYTAGGLAAGEDLTFTVEVTADEMASSQFAEITISSTETDLQSIASRTWSFEADTEGWTTVQGTFGRSSADGGGAAGSWYEQSSSNLNNQCDQIQSPVIVFSENTTLTMSTRFDIEPIYQGSTWYDRANVGVVPVLSGSRTAVSPSSGRAYNASGSQGTCGTGGQPGWAGTQDSWASSSWNASALGSAGYAGQQVRLDIRYGTDPSLNGYGFRFDAVTVTDFFEPGADSQPDVCGPVKSMALTKTGTLNDDDGTSGVSAGDTIAYAFSVENTGAVDLTNIAISDPDATVSGGPLASLAVGATDSSTFTASYAITQADIDAGSFTNTATANSDEGASASGSDTQALAQNPALVLTKAGTLNDDDGTAGVSAGDTISYTFSVENTGNVTHTGVTISDPDAAVSGGPLASLAVGATDSSTFTASYVITQADIDAGSFTNTASAGSNEGASGEDSDTRALAQTPGLSLVKTATSETFTGAGDVISYNFRLTNTGNTTLDTLAVDDPLTDDDSCPAGSLAPGEFTDCSATYTVKVTDESSGSVTNTATASANGGTVVSNSSSVTVNKIAAPTSVSVDDLQTGTQSAPRGKSSGTASVTILDNNDNAVSGYTVTGDFTGTFNEPGATATTDENGVAFFVTSGTAKKNIVVNFCVSDVSGELNYVANPAYACPEPAVSIDSFTASPTTINDDSQETTLSWSVSNADSCAASGGFGGWNGSSPVVPSGSQNYMAGAIALQDYVFTLTCSNASSSDSATVTVTVVDEIAGPSSVHVASIVTSTQGVGGGDKAGKATVTIVYNDGTPAPGYTVTGDFGGDITEPGVSSAPVTTGADGTVVVQGITTARGKVSVTFCVNNVTGSLGYFAGDNADPAYACTP
jgi:hypothetical protein